MFDKLFDFAFLFSDNFKCSFATWNDNTEYACELTRLIFINTGYDCLGTHIPHVTSCETFSLTTNFSVAMVMLVLEHVLKTETLEFNSTDDAGIIAPTPNITKDWHLVADRQSGYDDCIIETPYVASDPPYNLLIIIKAPITACGCVVWSVDNDEIHWLFFGSFSAIDRYLLL